MFWCPGPTGVGFGVPFFVSGLYKFMGKLADRIFFGVQGPRGLGLGCRSLVGPGHQNIFYLLVFP